ncbi:hypothetical protein UlMin_038744 [Ulmus minor]
MGATTAKVAWDMLQEEFQRSKKVCAVKLQNFRRDFENLKIKDNETAKDYYSRIKELVNQMRAYGENIIDKKIVKKILISCTEKFDLVISSEKRINRRNENTTENAFPSKINMQSQKSKVGGRKTQENFKNKNQVKYFENKSNLPPCGIYNRKCHLEKHCWFKPKQQCRNCKKIWACRIRLRFMHFNFHELKILWQKNMMRDLPTIKEMDETCEGFGSTPEKNGVSERKNIIVMETTRAMLMEKGLPKTLWAEAVYTAVYLLNRCPTNVVKNKTPVEAWSGRKPSTKHLRVFGCICYTHIPQEKRSKLDEKTEKGIFLGYSTQSKGYRVYRLRKNKLIISRDVKFDEDTMYNWETLKIEMKSINLLASPQLQPEEETDQLGSPTQTSTEQPT